MGSQKDEQPLYQLLIPEAAYSRRGDIRGMYLELRQRRKRTKFYNLVEAMIGSVDRGLFGGYADLGVRVLSTSCGQIIPFQPIKEFAEAYKDITWLFKEKDRYTLSSSPTKNGFELTISGRKDKVVYGSVDDAAAALPLVAPLLAPSKYLLQGFHHNPSKGTNMAPVFQLQSNGAVVFLDGLSTPAHIHPFTRDFYCQDGSNIIFFKIRGKNIRFNLVSGERF